MRLIANILYILFDNFKTDELEFAKHMKIQLENAKQKLTRLTQGYQNNPSDKQLEKASNDALENVNILEQLVRPMKYHGISDAKKVYLPRFDSIILI